MSQRQTLRRCVILLFVTLSLTASAKAQNASSSELQKQYGLAIKDAKEARPDEIYDKLTSIVRCNNSLQWKDFDGASWVLVTNWANEKVAGDYKRGQTKQTP